MRSPETKCCVYGCFEILPVSAFGKHPRTLDGLAVRCKACEAKRGQLARHGLTADDKDRIATAQDGCAICGRLEPGRKGWVVDHDRSCCAGDKSCPDCRRAILCQWCNTALGYAQDSPLILRRMADYLESQARLADAIPMCDPRPRLHTNERTERTNGEVTPDCDIPAVTQRARGRTSDEHDRGHR